MKEFLQKNGRSISILFVLVGGFFLIKIIGQTSSPSPPTAEDVKMPENGDVYVFTNDTIYSPMRLDSVYQGDYYMRDYLFVFEGAVPKKDEILSHEFDTLFYAIYAQEELIRLVENGTIIALYHP